MKKQIMEVPEKQYRPDVRWWLAEGLHTDETLKMEISDLHDAGFGAVEFLAESAEKRELCFVGVRCASGAREDLGRPTTGPQENKRAFMENLKRLADGR